MIAVRPTPAAVRSWAIPTRGECPLNPSPRPAAFAIAATRFEMARPVRSPNTRFRRATFSGRILRRAAAASGPTYSTVGTALVLELRTVARADPSPMSFTAPQRSSAASERRSMASRMTEAMAMTAWSWFTSPAKVRRTPSVAVGVGNPSLRW